MTVVQDIYFIISCLGFLYVVGSAVMGSFHSGGTHAGGHGHAGHLHAGSHGHGSSASRAGHIGHGSGHGAGHGAGHAHGAGSPPGSTAGHGGTAHGGAHAKSGPGQIDEVQQSLTVSQTTVRGKRSEVPALYLKVLDILSPTKLAFFAFMFGAIGFVTAKFLPGYLSIAPAAILGWIFANLFFNIMGRVFSRMNSSTNFKRESLIGAIGELSLSIENGGIGEVVVRTGNSRYNFTAKPATEGQSIKKLTKVIVVDVKDGIFVVEPFEEEMGTVHP